MEQINLEATQSILRERQAQVIRDAETRRMLRERSAAGSAITPAAAPTPVRAGLLVRLAALLRPAHRRPAAA